MSFPASNLTLARSCNTISLFTPKWKTLMPGPCRIKAPELPKRPIPAGGATNAAVSRGGDSIRSPVPQIGVGRVDAGEAGCEADTRLPDVGAGQVPIADDMVDRAGQVGAELLALAETVSAMLLA